MPERPGRSEYEDYYHRYVGKVPEGDVFDILAGQLEDMMQLLGGVSEEKAGYRYSPDKWSIKQVVGHMVDVERIFGYRALAFARRDKTPLPGMEQDEYVEHANFDNRTLDDIAGEFRAVRTSNLALFRGLDDEIFERVGNASGFDFTVRSIPYILAGHEIHHVIVLKERYL